MPSLDDAETKSRHDEVMVGESSQPATQQSQHAEQQKIVIPDRSAASSMVAPNGLPDSGGPARETLPSVRPAETADDMSDGSGSGTSSVPLPPQIESTALKAQSSASLINTGEGGPSGVSSTSSQAINLATAESAARPQPPPPQSASLLESPRNIRNGAPSSPMPLYARNLIDEQQLCCHSSGDSASEPELVGHEYPPDFAQVSASMKRKRPHPNKDSVTDPSIADSDIVAATHDVIALLQIYGPLSYIQLKVNIETQFEGEDFTPVKKLQQVLDILVELGVIHVLENNTTGPISPGRSVAEIDHKSDATNNNPVYSFGSGIPRMDVVLPSNALDEIRDAGNEILQTRQRIELLQSVLCVDKPSANIGVENNTKAVGGGNMSRPQTQEFAKKTLRQMLEQHPDIVHDPTYAAALRIFKVDDAKQQNRNKSSTVSSKGETASSKKRKKDRQKSTVNDIAESRPGVESPVHSNEGAS
ncbi:hypothetical protein HJC23_006792 [Cyclotella cryptica]|uniref:Uncharacterized protein n=1 Tax=Cyclotella cryptica TaxID=29204 RepID=A0ABD3PFU1_9STRA|eukprot:CCRYP_015121-RA/>CCRYP_015121-RA protein AED:0.13 eAED:0.13 QI:0/-1/0/1/-1/1/1/0/474